MATCSECKSQFPTVKALVHHMQLRRHNINGFYKCGEAGCLSKFSLCKSFKAHLRRVHNINDLDSINAPPVITTPDVSQSVDNCRNIALEEDHVSAEGEGIGNQSPVDVTPEEFEAALKAQAETYIARMYSKANIPRNCVQQIVDETDAFLGGGFLNILKDKCITSLQKCNADVDVIKDMQSMFDTMLDPFAELKTEHKRLKEFKKSGDYIPPVPYVLGKDFVLKTVDGVKRLVWTDVQGQHFPLQESLKKFLEQPNCLNDILSYMESLKSEEDIISNFVQGELWKSKTEKFSKDDIVLPLFVFFDDFECNNVLGPHSGKVGAVYSSIASLPPECRSTLENIFISLLFNSKDRQEFGNEKVLQPLIKELTFLEETGITVNTEEGEKKVYFVLGLLLGDNLGIHQICGFVECFKANYPCRFCRATKEQILNMNTVNERLLRNAQNYDADVRVNNVSRTGLNSKCEFNKIPSFHITSNYGVDVLHDVAEGVCKYVMGFIINECIRTKRFTLHDLNNRIRMFNYGPDVSNRPPVITEQALKKKKIKMSGAETLCFVRHFGVMVGDLIPKDDVPWSLYHCLMRVVNVTHAKVLPKSASVTFPVLVEELFVLYKNLGNHIRPKFHYLLHYALVIKMCGPPVHLSSIRFEGKHRVLKQTSVTNMSRVNLTYSIGVKHQLKQCSRFKSKQSILPSLEAGSMQECNLVEHDYYFEFFPSLPHCFREASVILSPKWINFKGTHYSKLMAVMTGRDENLFWPEFGLVQIILINQGMPTFICSCLHNLGFSDHHHAFEVNSRDEWFCVKVCDLVDPFPVSYCKSVEGEYFVITRFL